MIILREKREDREDPFNHLHVCIFDPRFTFISLYYWNNKYTVLDIKSCRNLKKLQYLRTTTDNFLWNFVIKLYSRSKVLSTQNRIRVSIVYQLKLFVIWCNLLINENHHIIMFWWILLRNRSWCPLKHEYCAKKITRISKIEMFIGYIIVLLNPIYYWQEHCKIITDENDTIITRNTYIIFLWQIVSHNDAIIINIIFYTFYRETQILSLWEDLYSETCG